MARAPRPLAPAVDTGLHRSVQQPRRARPGPARDQPHSAGRAGSWRAGSAGWLLDESDLAVTLLEDALEQIRAPGMGSTSGPGLTALGWLYIDTGRWDEAQEAAAEAAGLAEGNQMELVTAAADLIAATVLAMRGDSAAARRHADRALASVDPAETGLVAARAWRALGIAALADGSYLDAFAQLGQLSAGRHAPPTTSSPTWEWPISRPRRSGPTGGRRDKTSWSEPSAAWTERHLPGSPSSSPGPRPPGLPGRGRVPFRDGARPPPRGSSGHRAGPASP